MLQIRPYTAGILWLFKFLFPAVGFHLAMSKMWSCETLAVGYGDVMDEAYSEEERKLQEELKDHYWP